MGESDLDRAVGRIEGKLEQIELRIANLERGHELLMNEIRRLEVSLERARKRDGRYVVALVVGILSIWEALRRLFLG